MLTNEKIAAIHANAVAHGFHEPDSEPTFGEYCALIHEEISEAFSAWRNGEPDEYVDDSGKPQGVWVELADVVIRIGDLIGELEYELRNETDEYKRFYNDIRSMILDEIDCGTVIDKHIFFSQISRHDVSLDHRGRKERQNGTVYFCRDRAGI